jgi:hypothetical protein
MPIDLTNITNGNGSHGFLLPAASNSDDSGFSVASATDVNGDYSNLIVGAPGADSLFNSRAAGAFSYVIFGRGSGLDSSFVRV